MASTSLRATSRGRKARIERLDARAQSTAVAKASAVMGGAGCSLCLLMCCAWEKWKDGLRRCCRAARRRERCAAALVDQGDGDHAKQSGQADGEKILFQRQV